jgi:putative membrane protein
MTGFLIRMLISAAGLWLADYLIDGIWIRGTETLFWAALLLGIVNAVVRPLALVLTFPLTILTLGLFIWVVNAAMLGLVAAMLSGVEITGFFPALAGAAIISVTSWLASQHIGPRGRREIMIERRERR